MKGGITPLGYTIVEVMIVLAVSGLLFVVAANFINGKQERAAFTQGVNETASRVQGVIDQITDGQYSDIPLNCTFTGSTNFGGPTTLQGQNSGCVFLGKMLHLSEGGTAYNYEVFSIAGGRVDPSTHQPITDPATADPKVITALTTQQSIPQQLKVNNVTVNGGATQGFVFGFFQGQGTPDVAHGLVDGPQIISLYYIAGVSSSMGNSQAVTHVNATANLHPAKQIDICLTDDQQYADVIIGTNSNQLAINVKMYGTTKPAAPLCI